MQPVGRGGKGSLLSEIYLKSVEQDKGLRRAFQPCESHVQNLKQEGHWLFSDKRECWGEEDKTERTQPHHSGVRPRAEEQPLPQQAVQMTFVVRDHRHDGKALWRQGNEEPTLLKPWYPHPTYQQNEALITGFSVVVSCNGFQDTSSQVSFLFKPTYSLFRCCLFFLLPLHFSFTPSHFSSSLLPLSFLFYFILKQVALLEHFQIHQTEVIIFHTHM